MSPESYAHIRMEDDVPAYQTLEEHCKKAAQYAGEALKEIGLCAAGYLAGCLHDAGKAGVAFQSYLYDAVIEGKPVKRGSVNHSSAGCRFFLERYHNTGELDVSAVTAELLAYACGAHHGLFDCLDEKGGFRHKCTDPKIEYDDTIGAFLQHNNEDFDLLFAKATEEIGAVVEKILAINEGRAEDEADFYFGVLERLILSAVMEGDRRDTAEFMNRRMYAELCEGDTREDTWRKAIHFMEEKLSKMDSSSPINRARRAISDRCAAFAERPGGIIRLNVPTGAGKTLASLRYALRHAAKYNKTRIIFTCSLLSVLDQNAQVIRDFLPESEMALEHHSNVVQPEEADEREEWEMMTQAWRAPVIITTLVQLLNTMFLGRTGNIRRFHALCNAVLVIDEVQTVPNNLLTLFNLALNFLTEICGTTVVLCSATQPCLERADHSLLYAPKDMVPYDKELWEVFRRTQIQQIESRRLEELPALASQILLDRDSLLVVCNMKKEARELFALCRNIGVAVFHLSAGMCMQHRRDTLKKIQAAMKSKEKVLCISTQVIEAGVDISFGSVIRFLAGMDSVVQSAGRCNRNAESREPAEVYIVECVGERLGKLKTIKDGQAATSSLLEAFSQKPDYFGGSLTSDAAIEFYFRKLYGQMNRGFQDGGIPNMRRSLYNLLSSNMTGDPQEQTYVMHQAFKTAGENFGVFDTDTVEAIVGYGEGRSLRSRLIGQSERFAPDFKEIAALIRQAKPYTVSLYRYQREKLERCGALTSLFDGRVTVLSDGFYEENTGFTTDEQFLEV